MTHGPRLLALLSSLVLLLALAGGPAMAEDGPPTVVIFTMDFCPSCMAAKRWFREHDISFHELNVDQSETARERFERIGGRGIPTILVDDKRVEGFSEPRLRRLLQPDA